MALAACGSSGTDAGYAPAEDVAGAGTGVDSKDAGGDGASIVIVGDGSDASLDDGTSDGPLDIDGGEVLGDDAGSTGADGVSEPTGKLGPPYPIVLAHGFFGFQDFAGVDFVSYFFHVKENLAAHGEPLVFTPAVDPFNSSEVRGAQLAEQVARILAETGYAKVNLIGHSQGGLDARVVAHDHPDWVASVWTIATPHQGTPISDALLKIASEPKLQSLVDAMVKLVGRPLWEQMGDASSLIGGLKQFSKQDIAAFNEKYTDAPGVPYFSFSGRSYLSLGLGVCEAPDAPKFVSDYNRTLDPIDPLFSIPAAYLLSTELGGAANDGLVRAKDAKWGTWLGCVPADHLDEIGQLLGDGPGLGNGWDHQEFYVALVELLRSKGY